MPGRGVAHRRPGKPESQAGRRRRRARVTVINCECATRCRVLLKPKQYGCTVYGVGVLPPSGLPGTGAGHSHHPNAFARHARSQRRAPVSTDNPVTPSSIDSFGARDTLRVGEESYEIFRLDKVEGSERLPYSLKILLEALLRTEDGANITADHIRALGNWDAKADPSVEIQFTPARVIMQDFTGVPCVVDLATMREAVAELGGDPDKVNPLAPAELVIDHSVIIDVFGRPDAFERNVEIEYERNRERYQFLRWGQGAFDEFKVVPPGTGIVHQVNLEYLARTVMARNGQAYPDSCVGTDSHTTMVNGLGVLGWGVGGIEAEAAMLGQPVSMLIPRVVGFKL